ncbi:hypothetical protein CONLIGDRAFT_687597 [Coniochaeta ligniaria NRRL 30616]|uniref:Uncharacterized protein n=1 Tax=Coniochaeta ligniaria NRRL 30616 TaxID=1408157 RepID=A0A1J7IXV3_9PEZI|nr:hypothetical protein CONLIGDRAFT_687597 [Coniochaeta ligniaria NRRL 30616]
MSWYTVPLQRCIIALSLFQIIVTAAVVSDASLTLRQAGAPTGTLVTCLDYGSIANLSTIGLNATYRAAYLQAAPDGTDHSVAILNNAEAKLPPLTKNEALNQQCGNLTTIALTEAANNFTRGIVAQYRISAGVRNQGGLGLVIVSCLVTLGMFLVM